MKAGGVAGDQPSIAVAALPSVRREPALAVSSTGLRRAAGGRAAAGSSCGLLRLAVLVAAWTSCRATVSADVAPAPFGAAGHRRAQGKGHPPAPPAPRDEPWCAQLLERGALRCEAAAQLCPVACAAEADQPPPPPAVCAQLADRGDLGLCERSADLCPEACAAVVQPTTGSEDGAGVQTNCLVLLMLDGGCAYDLSQKDAALASGTRVSDVCPNECSGHGQCRATALDIAFLGSTDDSSGFGAAVEPGGNACVDGGGVTFDGESWATVTPEQDYGNSPEFTLMWWMLVPAEEVWAPHATNQLQYLWSHEAGSLSSVAGSILTYISRKKWLEVWIFRVSIAGTWADFPLNLLQDATPKWTQLAIVVEPTEIRVYEDMVLVQNIDGRTSTARHFPKGDQARVVAAFVSPI